MTIGGVSQNFLKRNQIPNCIGKTKCVCFEELSTYDGSFENSIDYVKKVKKQLELYLYLVQIHLNKEELMETPDVTYTQGFIIRNVLYFADLSRIYLQKQVKVYGNCTIQLPTKKIKMSDFIISFEYLYHAWDLSLEIFFNPDSEIPLSSLKTVLESHYEIINVYEKYNLFSFNGYTYPITSNNGFQNLYHLFY